MRGRPIIIALGFGLTAVAGFWLARSAAPEMTANKGNTSPAKQVQSVFDRDEPAPEFRRGERKVVFKSDDEAMEQGALVGQRALLFKDREALEAFLKRAADRNIKIMGRIDALNALRVGFLNYDDLADLLDGSEELAMIFPVELPESGSVGAQAGAVPIGARLLEMLGITMDNSDWGKGVKIAILDTGVSRHSAFSGDIFSLGYGTTAAAEGDVNGHGTAVASMILGDSSLLPGVAPGSTILSIQIADANGSATSMDLAQGIIAAADGGAAIINISMGSLGDSALVRSAIAYARERGILIVAATGNNGSQQISYPAGNSGVLAIGAVDGTATHLAFSNSGDSVALAAPGFAINAAWVDDGAVAVSGTSFSAPIISGLIAGTMTNNSTGKTLTAAQAYQLIVDNSNEAAAPGYDNQTGNGVPNMTRVMNSGKKGIYDAALASNWITSDTSGTKLQVVVENRGTETLINTSVQVTGSAGNSAYNITTLPVGAIQVFNVPFTASGPTVSVNSSVRLSGGQKDANRNNDSRAETLTIQPGN